MAQPSWKPKGKRERRQRKDGTERPKLPPQPHQQRYDNCGCGNCRRREAKHA